MRDYKPRGPIASLFSSKWFVVASCGAIAMVLGAMSVGARTSTHDQSGDDYPTPILSTTPIYISEDAGAGTASSQQAIPLTRRYAHRTIVPLAPEADGTDTNILDIQPVNGLSLPTALTPASAAISVSSDQLLGDANPLTSDTPDVQQEIEVDTPAEENQQSEPEETATAPGSTTENTTP